MLIDKPEHITITADDEIIVAPKISLGKMGRNKYDAEGKETSIPMTFGVAGIQELLFEGLLQMIREKKGIAKIKEHLVSMHQYWLYETLGFDSVPLVEKKGLIYGLKEGEFLDAPRESSSNAGAGEKAELADSMFLWKIIVRRKITGMLVREHGSWYEEMFPYPLLQNRKCGPCTGLLHSKEKAEH